MMAITGVILLVDDFLTYLRGGESAFAEFWQPLIEWANLAYEKIMLFSQWVSENLPEAITGLALIVALFGNQLAAIGGMGVKVFAALMRFSGVTKVFSLLSGGLQILLGWGSKLLVLLPRIATAIRAAFISNPVGAVISIVAALAYSIYWLIKNWDDVKKSVGEFVDSASQWLETLSNNISTWFENKFNALSRFFEEFGKTIKAPFDTAFKWIKEQYDKYISPIVDTVRNFSPSSIVDSVADGAKGLWNSVTDLFNDENPSTVGTVTQQALTQSSADNRMTNSNNKITQHFTINGSGDLVKDISKVTLDATNAILKATPVDVHISMTLVRYEDFTEIDKDEVKRMLSNLKFKIGEDVSLSRLYSPINTVGGFWVKSLKIGKSSGVLNAENIIIQPRELARIQRENIQIEVE
ncbi:hypothetical protein [Pasteurella multocida]|uniref:hypothetical protein n=1 Tax=Pasteurella multocida TaxID=747 RepID=UPI001896B17F|nr:hypothetical protein [Pasteurella multocida]MBF6986072.1 hypothetical protein [Pasteurella multocida]